MRVWIRPVETVSGFPMSEETSDALFCEPKLSPRLSSIRSYQEKLRPSMIWIMRTTLFLGGNQYINQNIEINGFLEPEPSVFCSVDSHLNQYLTLQSAKKRLESLGLPAQINLVKTVQKEP